MDIITGDLEMGRSWDLYRDLTRCVSPTSAEAERTFSYLSRLRSKFRRKLHVHLEACLRISQAKTLGSGFEYNSFIDEVLTVWDEAKVRRNRPLGLATGPHIKRIRVIALAPSTDCSEPEHTEYQDNDELDDVDNNDNLRIQISTTRELARVRMAAFFGNEDESDSD